jgi:hypothetical protein
MLDDMILSAVDWQKAVLKRDADACAVCKSTEGIQVYYITPKSLGGRTIVANGVTLCLTCRASNATRAGQAAAEFLKVRWNVPLSQEFLRDLNLISMAVGRSVSDIVREVMSEAVFTSKWDRLETVPTNGSPPERTNVWIAKPVFEKFEQWCKKRDLTAPTAIRSLLWAWAQDIQKGV